MKFPFLKQGNATPLLGLCIMYPSPGVVERIGGDWDWIWIDAQHGDLDFRDAADLVRAAHLVGRPALVRVPGHDEGWVGKALDTGAAGVIVPMVESIAEAKAMIRAAKFPPLGNRSYGGRRVIDFAGRCYYESANRETSLILQVESVEAVGLADEIAALDGVDGLFLGPDDLMIRNGFHVDTPKNRENLGELSKAVAQACQRHGKWSVCVAMSEPMMEIARDCGVGMAVGGGDVPFLVQTSKAASEKARAFYAKKAVNGGGMTPANAVQPVALY